MAAYNSDLPVVSIQHQQTAGFLAGQPIVVQVAIQSDEYLIESRCYFRFSSTTPFFYIDLHETSPGSFTGTLPAPALQITNLEYFFLIVNTSRQVLRTTTYELSPLPGTASPITPNVVQVKTELFTVPDIQPLLAAKQKIALEYVSGNKAYGLSGGVYSASDFSGMEHVEGFFGGFIIKQDNPVPKPLRGLLLLQENSLSLNPDRQGKRDKPWGDIIPDISGADWTGLFFIQDGDQAYGSQPITAVISQTKGFEFQVTIRTSKKGIGGHLRGIIHSNGHMLVYDQLDGEDWTTYYGPASPTFINLLDYVRPPQVGVRTPPLYRIRLTRTPISSPKKATAPPFLPYLLL